MRLSGAGADMVAEGHYKAQYSKLKKDRDENKVIDEVYGRRENERGRQLHQGHKAQYQSTTEAL